MNILSLIVYGVEALFSIGIIFRKELFRWLLLIFTVFYVIFNIYITLIASAVVSVVSQNPAVPLLAFFAVATKFLIPIGVIIVLNMPSVKNSFS